MALVSIFVTVNPPGMIAVDLQYDHPVPVQFIIIIRLDQDIIYPFRRRIDPVEPSMPRHPYAEVEVAWIILFPRGIRDSLIGILFSGESA